MMDAKPKRRWLQFSILDLLLLTAIVALSLGWWLDHQKLTKENLGVIKIFPIAEAEPNALFESVRGLFPENGDVSLSLDPGQKLIMARGPIPQLEVIEATILRLDVKPTPVGSEGDSN